MKNTKCYILKGARVVDPTNNIDQIMDIGIENGKFANPEKLKNPEIMELNGLVVAPGFIDMHVHLRQPGGTQKETIKTGTMAAAAGGFTTILAMPNTKPICDTAGAIEYINRHVRQDASVKVLPSGCITRGSEGTEMASIGGLKKAGIYAVTDDGKCVQNNEMMYHVLEYCKTFNLPVLDHCEDDTLATDGLVHDGYWSTVNGFKAIPSASEVIMVTRDIVLAEAADGKIHLQHISAGESVHYTREAQKRGIKVTAEVTPHHIALTDECIDTFDTNYKMNPPLRSEADRQALIEGLKDDTITVIATDHAPHTETEKLVEFAYAPFGVIGLETAVSVSLTELYHTGVLTLPQFISKFTKGPADVLGIDAGSIKEGNPADITILDIDKEHTVDKNSFYSKSKNTPFDGKKVKGKAVGTIVNGKFVYSELEE